MSVRRISPQQARALQQQGAWLVDVRQPDEWQHGIAAGAHCLALTALQQPMAHWQDKLPADRSQPLMLICQTSQRSAQAAEILGHCGYANLAIVAGGMQAWQAQALPTEKPALDAAGLRYDRHLRLPQWDAATQAKLGNAHVLLIGAGGLGSPAALYLAAAGVGTLTLVDDDRVDISNLQRQVLHSTGAVGSPKVLSAEKRLQALNPLVRTVTIQQRLDKHNAPELIAAADVVVDGSDNLDTRYLVNALCCQSRTPLVYAAVFQFEGQVSTFDFRRPESPCYACLFPPTEAEEPANCSAVGVLGVVPGVAGTLQASEATKVLTGIGTTLNGQLLTFDLLDNRFRRLSLRKDPVCPVCGSGH